MFLTFLLLAFFLNTASAYAQEPPERIIAAQVFRSDARNIQEFEEQIVRMKGLGINTIIFRVFGNNGDRVYAFVNPKAAEGVYFKTNVSPVIDDILGKVTDAAHKHRVKIFAWMTTRHATYGGDAALLDSEYSFSRKKLKGVPKLDLFNDKSVRYLEALYKDLAAYPVDGVLIQDDFVMRYMEGFGSAASAAYSRQFGKALDSKSMFSDFELKPDGRVKRIVYTQEFRDFTGWKNARLRAVAKRLIKSLGEARLGIEVALNVSYELFQKPQNALAWFSHDWALARQFDYAAVMSYQEQIKKELGIGLKQAGALIEDNAATAIKVMGNPEKVIMKIQTIDWDTRRPLPYREVRYIFHKLHSVSPDLGIALVPWEGNEKFGFLRE